MTPIGPRRGLLVPPQICGAGSAGSICEVPLLPRRVVTRETQPLHSENTMTGRLRREVLLFPRQFWLLVGGTFLYLLGYEIGYPFETVYLHARLGVSMTSVGLIIGLPILAGLPVQIAGGAIADRFGRRGLLILGICAGIVLFEGLALAGKLWQVITVIAIEAAFGWAMFSTANNSMLADLTPLVRRADAYGISRVAVTAGMAVGPLVGGLLLGAGLDYRVLFASGGVVCALFLLLVLLRFEESKPAWLAEGGDRLTTLAGYRVVLRDRRFLAFCGIALLPLYGFGQIYVTLPVLLRNSVGTSPADWGLLAALYAGSAVLLQYPVVRRTKRYDKLGLLSIASVCIGAGLAGAAFASRGIGTAACVLLISVGTMLFVPIAPAFVSEMAPAALRGRYMGAWTFVWMGGTALGPTFGGLAMDRLSGRGAYLVILAAALSGALLFALLRNPRTGPSATADTATARRAQQWRARSRRSEAQGEGGRWPAQQRRRSRPDRHRGQARPKRRRRAPGGGDPTS
jgi:MFS family permease